MIDIGSFPLFYQIAALLVLAATVGLLGVTLKQPLIVSYIILGLVAGPSALGIAQANEHIELLAELGVAVLLFLVGLKLDTGLIRSVGPVAAATGIGQIVFTALIGFLICLGLGLDWLTSLYVAVALTFSSTIIVIKLLSDKGELGSLHGRIALGFLIVQDIFVVLAMVVLSTFGLGTDAATSPLALATTLASAVALLIAIAVFIRYIADPLMERLSRAPELLVSFAIGWAAMLAALGDYLGFGKELGGLLAGVSLASTPFRDAMSTRLTSLRDFLLLFFFIALGARLDLTTLGGDILPALSLSLFVLIGNPLIVLAIMGGMGYRKRTGFLAGLTVAQISEFSLIFMAMGLTLGHVQESALGLVTLVGLVTIAASVYMIIYSHQLYRWIAPLLSPFERANPVREAAAEETTLLRSHDIIVFGIGRYGGAILQLLRERGLRVLGVDFSPVVVRRWREEGADVIYGDVSDPDFIGSLGVRDVKWVVSALPEHDVGLSQTDVRISLIQALRSSGYKGRIAASASGDAATERLRASGADLIMIPSRDAAGQAVDMLMGERPTASVDLTEIEDQKEFAL